MTDLEISKALALAIGYRKGEPNIMDGKCYVPHDPTPGATYREFDYRDWSVIGPIAERYGAFPQFYKSQGGWFSGAIVDDNYAEAWADTPQKAIALAVIEGAKP